MLYKSFAAAVVMTFGFIAFAKADAAVSLRAIEVGLIQYGPAMGRESAYAISINDHGQVIGRSEEDFEQRWGVGMLWQPTAARATTGTLHNATDFFGTHNPNRGYRPNGLGERGEVRISSGRLFVPDVPNGLTGQVLNNWTASMPNANGVAVDADSDGLYRVDLAGNRTAVAGAPVGADVDTVGINTSGQIFGYTNAAQQPAFVWTPDVPNGLTGSFVTLNMPAMRGSNADFYFNNAGQIVKTLNLPDVVDNATSTYLYRPGPGGGTVVGLDDLLGVPAVTVFDLNDAGQMLAYFYEADSFRLGNFLLTPDGNGGFDKTRLDLLPTQRIDAQTLVGGFYMTTLNNNGQLAGTAAWSYDNGLTWQQHATILAVPEPSTLLAAATPICWLLRRCSKRA